MARRGAKLFRPELLDGQEVVRLIGAEMALAEDGPEWTHPAVPCLQLVALFFCLADGRAVSLTAFFNDDSGAEFLLKECSLPELYQGEPDEIYRTRVLDEFAGGVVRSVKIEGEGDEVELWHVQVGSAELVMVAAEVEAGWEGYRFRRPDESILLFSSPSHLESIRWNQYKERLDRTSSSPVGRPDWSTKISSSALSEHNRGVPASRAGN